MVDREVKGMGKRKKKHKEKKATSGKRKPISATIRPGALIILDRR